WNEMLGSLAQLYARGVEIDWVTFDRDYARRKLSLPTYPFQRERYWFESTPNPRVRAIAGDVPPESTHPLAGRRLESPSLKETVFETMLSAASLPFVSDHRVFGRLIFPATGHLEAVRAAANIGLGQGPWALDDVVIGEALALSDEETRRLQVV